MATVEIKKLTTIDEIINSYKWIPNYCFHATPPLVEEETRNTALKNRKAVTHFALFEEGKTAALAASTPMSQNVRGKIFPMAGIFNVASHPTYRRKGYSRQVIKALLKEISSKYPLTGLYPFRESYYERLGYVSFPQPIKAEFNSSNLQSILKRKPEGQVDLMLASEGNEQYINFMKKYQKDIHGVGLFDYPKPPQTPNDSWLALAKIADETVGLMVYKLTGQEVTRFKFKATRFYYNKPEGLYLLLDWISRHIDQATNVELWLPATEKPSLWKSDLEVDISNAWIPGMGRILKVAGIGGVNVGPGKFSAEIIDPHCPWNEGIWQFEEVAGKLNVSQAKIADCKLSIQGLSGLFFGVQNANSFAWQGWGNPTDETQKNMNSLFPGKMPHMHEHY